MNRRLLSRLSEGSHSDFVEQFCSSRYEFVGIELYDTNEGTDPIAHRMLASGHQGRVRFSISNILEAIDEAGANSITLIHNHPFAPDIRPSKEDISVTDFMHASLLERGLDLLDHRIYGGEGGCFSFAEAKIGRLGWECVDFF